MIRPSNSLKPRSLLDGVNVGKLKEIVPARKRHEFPRKRWEDDGTGLKMKGRFTRKKARKRTHQ